MIKGVGNPFLVSKADDTVKLPAGDVPDLHAPILGQCIQRLADARACGQSLGFTVIGETGSGKSHMIAQLRRHLAGEKDVILASVRFGGATVGRLWRHLRDHLFEEMLRPLSAADGAANGLTRLLQNRFPKWAAAAKKASGGSLIDFITGNGWWGRADTGLTPHLKGYAQTTSLDGSLIRVLPHIGDPAKGLEVGMWLRGQPLSDEERKSIGLVGDPPNDEQAEDEARSVVRSLLRLAGDKTVIYLVFDQIEGLQASITDAASLDVFIKAAYEVLAEAGPRVVATFARPVMYDLLFKTARPVEHRQIESVYRSNSAAHPRPSTRHRCRASQRRPGTAGHPLRQHSRQQVLPADR